MDQQPEARDGVDGGDLAELLATIARPLAFLVKASAPAAARTQIPAQVFIERAQRVLSAQSDVELKRQVEGLCSILAELSSDPDHRAQRAQRALEVIEEVRRDFLGIEPPAVVPRAAASRPRVSSAGAPPSQRSTPAPAEVLPPYHETTANSADALEALAQSVQFVPGVGPRRALQFEKLGIRSVEDLLYHLPFRYEDRRTVSTIRDLRPGETASVIGEITHMAERFVGRRRRPILEGVLRDDTGLMVLTWFNQVSFFKNQYQVGQRCLVHGKVEADFGAQKRIVHPEIDTSVELAGRGLLPVYNKPTTMTVAVMRKLVHGAVDEWSARLPSVLPKPVVEAARITDLRTAMRLLHYPQPDADLEALNATRSGAHRSLVFDELFFLQLGMALRRRSVELETGLSLPVQGRLTARLHELLPFALTAAQQRVLREIYADMARPHPLHRLLQGDVGSGKTIVALFAALVAIENGYQAAFMAPTELLAEQHFATIERFAAPLAVRTLLLTGEMPRPRRREAYARILAGEVDLVVGTHALIQESVEFKNIGLGVIDEQHRFGVLQRAALRRLGGTPDILLMTATPIPRTLAMTVYGDLDISVIDEMPPGRTPVRTLLRHEGERTKVYDLVKRELDRGCQGYVVYPLVESSEEMELRDATTMAEELARTVFYGYRVGLVHGRMKGAEKDAVMRRFKAGDIQLLVSTTVIEVGIDVPNATIMVVEHAERFGLAQLHQLRGRVGRGQDAALCVLLTAFHRGDDVQRRLQAMASTNDGFKIAEADLEIRGPGELLGTRQSGLPDFRVANLIRDARVLDEARRAAASWLEHDPQLQKPESKRLRAVLAHRWAGRLELAEIG